MRIFSQEAIERPRRTVQAASVLRENAGAIWQASANALEDEIVVAVVYSDLTFAGAWAIARSDMVRQVLYLEDQGGWSLIFSSKTPVSQIEQRCKEFSSIASRKQEVMQRWLDRQARSS
jgi:hypothetical protein